MDDKQASGLASCLVGGGRLAPVEEQEFLELLRKDDVARDAYLADEEIDGLLHCMAAVASTEDDFVAATVQRAMGTSDVASEPPAQRDSQATIHIVTGANSATRRDRGRGILTSATLFAVVCAILVVAIGLLQPGPPRNDSNAPGETSIVEADKEAPPVRLVGFATLEAVGAAEWDAPHADGDRLDSGELQLVRGEVVIRFDKGTVARVSAPAVITLVGPDEVALNRGRIAADVPPEAVGFTVATRTSRIVDLGTRFDVIVDEAGKTETTVQAGRVSFVPQSRNGPAGRSVELSAEGLDRAFSDAPDVVAPHVPVWTVASGRDGAFHASIFADGKALEFASRDSFEETRSLVVRQLHDSPSEFASRWSVIVDATSANEEPVGSSTARESTAATDDSPRSGGRTTTVTVNDRTITISEDDSGITVTTITRIAGREERSVVHAADAGELRMKDPAAYRLYVEYLGEGRPSDGGRPKPRRNADEMLREQLRRQLDANAGNPQMRALLERMLQELDAED